MLHRPRVGNARTPKDASTKEEVDAHVGTKELQDVAVLVGEHLLLRPVADAQLQGLGQSRHQPLVIFSQF